MRLRMQRARGFAVRRFPVLATATFQIQDGRLREKQQTGASFVYTPVDQAFKNFLYGV
jgi:hypothetical protein